MEYLLGIDIGTSGTKTVLFDLSGNVMASASSEYPMYQPKNGWAEQRAEDWWNAVCITCKSVLSKSKIAPADIKGVGLSGQMHGLVMLDEDNKVIRPSIIWCDNRTAEECKEITQILGTEKLIGITANPALTGFTASKIMWVKKHEPQNYAACKHIMLPKDYIRFMLTGEYATEVSDASGMQLLDVPHRKWSNEVLDALEIDEALLGKVYESVEITGRITQAASDSTGLSVDTPVIGGAGDNAAAAVGTGVVSDGKAFTTIGSSGVLFTHTSRLAIDPKGRVHTFCCAVPGAWHVMGVTQAAGLSLKWFRDNLCQDYVAKAKKRGVSSYTLMDKDAERVPIGCNKLIYLPYLMGERTPHLDPNCRGVFFGLSAIHTKPDMIRAIMEGVSYSLKDCYSILEEMGARPDEMMICGGGANSELWRQMLSDIYSCEVKTTVSKEGPALGVAILAGVGAGLYSSVEDACAELIKTDTLQKPIHENTEKYEKFYSIYKALYGKLKEQYDALNSID